ncbi:putative cytochrome B561 [Pseudomonas sp. BAY1663]|uniref:cytochrome b n=1 Tax=Pseudomonas sp. BAY1663 TaxID=1439940 RepID=UPI00042DE050|nr:cytochrome b/b6 domain-containing protein [Pseudomonas sp. BAY1663]EXF45375.1 putative cytochrome B561 [Pseudomonas sp. BAY1663]
MTRPRFTRLQIACHWLTAALILLIVALPYGSEAFFEALLGGKGNVFTLHKSLGVLVLLLTVLRLFARRRAVEPLPAKPQLERFMVAAGHGVLYLLLLALPLSGLLFGSRPFSLFWLVEVGPLPLSSDVRGLAKDVHILGQYLLFTMLIGHAGAALWHHYVRRDDTLKGMLPLLR